MTDILRLPSMSFIFNELDFNKALRENQRFIREKKKTPKKSNQLNGTSKFILFKPKKGDLVLTITARMSKLDGSSKIVKSD